MESEVLHNGFTKAQIANAITPRKLHLTIMPTEQCNFRCTYCYEDFEHGRMKDEVVDGLKNMITARGESGLEHLVFSWFGGEPLLALPVIREILEHSSSEAKRCGFLVTGSYTTNAYLLTPEVARELISHGTNFFQITLDGWREVHDTTRRRADGAGTFDRIWKNLISLKSLDVGFEVSLRVHMRPDNLDSVRELCGHIKEEFGADGRFDVDFQDIRNMGGANGEMVDVMARKRVDELVHEMQALMRGEAATAGEAGSNGGGEHAEEPRHICYAAKANHFLIRSTGRVGKCTIALDDERNDVGMINRDGTLTYFREKGALWLKGFETLDAETLGCPLHTLPQLDTLKHRTIPIVAAA